MKVYIEPPQNMSRAMFRVSNALKQYAPVGVSFVPNSQTADLEVLHVIGMEGVEEKIAQVSDRYAVIQYCLKTAGGSLEQWQEIWQNSKFVWSYYDLPIADGTEFYYAPLGVDGNIFGGNSLHPVRRGVFTSGYVSGPGAEAIEEVADAAFALNLSVFHLGPAKIEGMQRRREKTWYSQTGLSDEHLSRVYRTLGWVSGLRFVEGFELPVIEGLSCGLRPIVFDRPEMRKWFQGHAVFVPECHGAELVSHLKRILQQNPPNVSHLEQKEVREKFDWELIAAGFWERALA